jgi:hypothetical protein
VREIGDARIVGCPSSRLPLIERIATEPELDLTASAKARSFAMRALSS